ncbi:MAG: hypothetical protein F9K32_03450 [Desulfobulbaceae bacterium]|nr:MAG: hypothetical protein F9K32_03450 [Desulfobulbaceae bacterium]
MNFKDQWNLETALKILQHQTVDSQIWAEAVEWLMLFGPPEIKDLLLKASGIATETYFPELKPIYHSAEGEPYYNIAALARALGISEEDAQEIIRKKEREHQMHHLASGGSETVH